MTSWTRAALASLAALVIGCGGKPAPDKAAPPASAAPPAGSVTPAAPAPPASASPSPAVAQPAADAADAAPAAPAAAPAGDTGDAGTPPIMAVSPVVEGEPSPKMPMVSRETLEKAYMEIYCAQRKGEADKLITVFERYGFQDPRAWTVAWTEAVKDQAWVARITQQAMASCP